MSIPRAPGGVLVPVEDIEGGYRYGQWQPASSAQEADFDKRWREPAVLTQILTPPAGDVVDQHVSMNFVHDGVRIFNSYSGRFLRVEQRVVLTPAGGDASLGDYCVYSHTRTWIQLDGANVPTILDGLPASLAQKVYDHTAHYDAWIHTASEWPCARWEHWLRAPVEPLLSEARRHLTETAQALRLQVELSGQACDLPPTSDPPPASSHAESSLKGPRHPSSVQLDNTRSTESLTREDNAFPSGVLVPIPRTHKFNSEGEWRRASRAQTRMFTKRWSEPVALTQTLEPRTSEGTELLLPVQLVDEGRRTLKNYTGRLLRVEQQIVLLGSASGIGLYCHGRTWLQLHGAAKPTVLDGLPSTLMRMLEEPPTSLLALANFEWPCSRWEHWGFGGLEDLLAEVRAYLAEIAQKLGLEASVTEASVIPKPRATYRESPSDLARLAGDVPPNTPHYRLLTQLASGHSVDGIDFKDAQLSGLDLYKARLDGAVLDGADLRGANLNNATLRGVSLVGACLEDADLEHADLSGAQLCGAKLAGAMLAFARLEGADLRGSQLDGADLSHASLTRANLEGIVLADVDLAYARFPGARLYGGNLHDVRAAWSSWRDTDLTQARLSAVGFENVTFDQTTLRQAHISGCTFDGIESKGASFDGACFRENTWKRPFFEDCNFTGADLQGEQVPDGNLIGCNFEGTDLRRASINSTSFENSSLRNADLRGADLSRNGMRGVPFNGAQVEGLNLAHTELGESAMEDAYLEDTIVLSKPKFRPRRSAAVAVALLREAMQHISAASENLPWASEHPDGRPWRLDDAIHIEGYRRREDQKHRIATVDLHHLDIELARQATNTVCGLLRNPQADIDAARLIVGTGKRSSGYGGVLAPELSLLLARENGVIVRPETQGAPHGWMDLIVPGKVVQTAHPARRVPHTRTNKRDAPSGPLPTPTPTMRVTVPPERVLDTSKGTGSKGWGWVLTLAFVGTLIAPGPGTLVGAAVGWVIREVITD